MKKAIFAALAVALALPVISCNNFLTADNDIPSVQYSKDGSEITLRIDGKGGPDRNLSRALTDDLAKKGHDFYEVVFADSTTTVRASWEIGQAAGIRGVPRGAGIDYGDLTAAIGPAVGHAVLFVGRKTDKTLLAVGTLTATDTGGTTVLLATKTATFTVAALTAGASSATATSSFLTGNAGTPGTASAANTTITPVNLEGKSYPMYQLPHNLAAVAATYTIDCTGTIADYLPGIRVQGVTGLVSLIRAPRISLGSGEYIEPDDHIAIETDASLDNNITPGTAFANIISISFDTTKPDPGICAFTFDIPVYAIDSTDSITWHIKPGYGTGPYNLDDGTGSTGGAVLLAVGSVNPSNILWVFVE